jgi:ubiquinone/menaquinone biosynthesis C-methylase UbiE
MQRATAEQVRHPLFARLYVRLAQGADGRGGAGHRRELLVGASGRVLEIGAGAGANFEHYPPTVREVLALEPERHLRERAQQAAAAAPVPVSVREGVASQLPVEDAGFDVGVASLVLCTVPDQRLALAELFRVIRPGGELRFFEHVAARSARLARVQRALDATVWPRLNGGCHTSRDTEAAISAAGFQIEERDRFSFRAHALAAPVAPRILGRALRP